MTDPENIHDILEIVRQQFPQQRVLVIGDQMLDRYLWGSVSRISPEAPVPVLVKESDAQTAGGAANVALNIRGLGLDVDMLGIVGDDDAGRALLDILAEAAVGTDGILPLAHRPTVTKTRVITGHQHVLRIDAEDTEPLDEASTGRLCGLVRDALPQVVNVAVDVDVDAVVLSDYRKGLLSDTLCQTAGRLARERGIPVFVDPKGTDWERYRGATVVTPNLNELELVTGVSRKDGPRKDGKDGQALIAAGRELCVSLEIDNIVLTRGADGMTLITRDEVLHSPAVAREVFDVTGAGDTVIATLAAGITAGLDWPAALHVANAAAGIVVGKVGAVPVAHRDLLRAIHPKSRDPMEAVYSLEELAAVVERWKARGERVVFTNGCFDILHAGHITYLQWAAQEGDRLVVALNTDSSVRRLKGKDRPVIAEQDRACIVAALGSVDAVVLFDEDTPIDVIAALRPDVLVKGGDYVKDRIVGAAEVESWGGRVVVTSLVEGRSTSAVIKKLSG